MNYVKEYLRQIEAGEIIACKRTVKIYKRLVYEMDNPGKYIFDEAKAQRPIDFIEKYCKHSKGEFAGQPVFLELFQKAYIQALFGFVDKETGLRRFKESFFMVARKNGKSTMLSGIKTRQKSYLTK